MYTLCLPAVQTTGKPIDLRIDSITRQDDGRFTVRTSWIRPLQSNGVTKTYFVNYWLPAAGNSDRNGVSDRLSATMVTLIFT